MDNIEILGKITINPTSTLLRSVIAEKLDIEHLLDTDCCSGNWAVPVCNNDKTHMYMQSHNSLHHCVSETFCFSNDHIKKSVYQNNTDDSTFPAKFMEQPLLMANFDSFL